MTAFGDRLRAVREVRGLSQRDFAERVGVDFTYISKIETGVMAAPSDEVIRKMAEVLDVWPDNFLNWSAKAPQWGEMLEGNYRLVEILRHLATRKLSDEDYDRVLDIVWLDRHK